MTQPILTSMPDLQGVQGAQPPVACDNLDREISPYDAEAEPEDLAAMEIKLSETTEDDTKLTAEEQDELCGEGLQEPSGYPPEGGCCDMSPEQYDPLYADGIPQDGSLAYLPDELKIAMEMEELCLAEPEPPEETCSVPAASAAGKEGEWKP